MSKSRTTKAKPTDKYDPDPYFKLLDLYFESDKRTLVSHQIDSYNQYIAEIIPSIVNGDHTIYEKITENKVYRHYLHFADLAIQPPMIDDEEWMYPLDALQSNYTYASKITATVTQYQEITDIATQTKEVTQIGDPGLNIPIAKVPVMVGSNYCNLTIRPGSDPRHCQFDAGGYFIISGSEKVVLSLEAMIQRKPLVFTQKDQTSITYYVKVQSRPATQFVGNTQSFTIKIKKDNSIVMVLPWFKEISIFTFMRALGLETDTDIINSIIDPNKDKTMMNFLFVALNSSVNPTVSKEAAMNMLYNSLKYKKQTTQPETVRQRRRKNNVDLVENAQNDLERQRKLKYLNKILSQYILPHVTSGTGDQETDNLYKAYYIGYMINKLLSCYLNRSKEYEENKGCDDRDSMINKRIETAGFLLGTITEQYFRKMLSECNKMFVNNSSAEGKPPQITRNIKENIIEQRLRQALSSGSFGTAGSFGAPQKKGVSQSLNRMNHLHTLSYLRRVISPTADASTNKLTGPRHLHNSQYGSMDPMETPSGNNTGYVKNLTLSERITINMNSQLPIIHRYLEGKLIKLENILGRTHQYVGVFVNGNRVGFTDDIIKLHAGLREMRFIGALEKMVSLVFLNRIGEFHIYTDGGRLIRPYLTVTDNELNFKPEMLKGIKTWDEFLIKHPHVIEFIDKEEEQNIMLATYPEYIQVAKKVMTTKPIANKKQIEEINRTNRYDGHVYVKYTHCEIHPCMIFGLISSNIPFTDRNPSSRGIFQYNQARQAMGFPNSDLKHRIDITYNLYHPMLPIVSSRAAKYTGTNIFPNGENIMVAIASYTGYNQEDSLVMNLSSIEHGMFRAQSLARQKEVIKKSASSLQAGKFMKPDPKNVTSRRMVNYDKLSEEGYVKKETQVKYGDVIISVVKPKTAADSHDKQFRDSPTIYKSLIPGAIDDVFVGTDNNSYPIIKMRVRSEKIPMIGDKFSSRHSQKGTVGIMLNRWDMPFSVHGYVPDIIINPNCMPRRMTIGQFFEGLMAKVCVMKGVFGDGTPFTGVDVEELNRELKDMGMMEYGLETLYNGITGEKITTPIFLTPTYYQRLKQMVGDKVHHRSTGPNQLLTRQPTEGKSKNGGLKIGEMERDSIVSHGMAQFLTEKMVDNSDLYYCHICDICGYIVSKVPRSDSYYCKLCDNSTKITQIKIPYVFKLFVQELRSMSISARIRTRNSIRTVN